MTIFEKSKEYLLGNYMAVLAILFVLILSIILSISQLFILLCLNTSHIAIFITVIIDIMLFLTIIKVGFKMFKNNNYFNRVLAIAFGLLAYLSLLFQFGIIFFTYYLLNGSSNIIPNHLITTIIVNRENTTGNILKVIKLILNYVFPNFFKYPTSTGVAVIIQFFLGKFTDLFILAYIVEQLKNKRISNR